MLGDDEVAHPQEGDLVLAPGDGEAGQPDRAVTDAQPVVGGGHHGGAQVLGEQRGRRSPAPGLLGLLHLLHLGLEHPAGAGGHGLVEDQAVVGAAGDDHAGQTAVDGRGRGEGARAPTGLDPQPLDERGQRPGVMAVTGSSSRAQNCSHCLQSAA